MSLKPMIPAVIIPLLASAAAMAYAASTNSRLLAVCAAASFALAVLIVANRLNAQFLDHDGTAARNADREHEYFHVMRRNTRLVALVYAWAGATFLAVYTLSDLKWRHGLQYGMASSLIAAGFLAYVHWMGSNGKRKPPSLPLTLAHAGAVAGGLTFLVLSGKLETLKGDWAANYIFLFGGLALLGIAAISIKTHRARTHSDANRHEAAVPASGDA